MPTRFERILSYKVLLLINIAIVLATEWSGQVFVETGIIHLIAIGFVVLGISRIFIHYDAHDQYLRPLIVGGVFALLIFSASHLVELVGYVYFKLYEDSIFVSMINFYVVSMLVVTIGAEHFLRALKRNSLALTGTLIAVIAAFLFLTALMFLKQISVSLDLDSLMPYLYAVLVLGTCFLSVSHLMRIKRSVAIMAGFANHFIAAFILISISALQYVFYDVLEAAGVPAFQVIYSSHFLFYGALSLMFLAFVSLSHLSGIYKDLEKYKLGKLTD